MPTTVNETIAATTVTLTKSTKKLIVAEVRQYRDGVEIKLQSDVLEDWFMSNAAGSTGRPATVTMGANVMDANGGSIRLHRLYGESEQAGRARTAYAVDSTCSGGMAYAEHGALTAGGSTSLNFSYLRVVGLKAGVTIRLVNTVHTKELMKRWGTEIEKYATALYREYMKPVAYKITVTVEELR